MNKVIVFEIVLGLGLLCLLITGIVAVQVFRSPLSQPLSLVQTNPTATPPATSTAAPKVTNMPPTQIPTAIPTVAAVQQKTCGMSGTMSVLMIGRDENYWKPPYGADAIRMVKIDFGLKKVNIFAFPRDLKLYTPSLVKYNFSDYTLGQAYELVQSKEGRKALGTDIKATNEIAQILYDNFGIKPDHYITIQENVLPELIDTVGGIEVAVPEAIVDQSHDLNIKQGNQVFNGNTAMRYSRYVKNDSSSQDEWGRLDRQAVIVKGLTKKMVDPANFAKVPELYNKLSKSVVTDLTPEQILSLACMMKEVPMDDISTDTIQREEVTIGANYSMIIKDINAIRNELQTVFQNQ